MVYNPDDFPDYDSPGQSSKLTNVEWYHGAVSRIGAEAALKKNGDFLVRDSISEKGGYVLTCRWNDKALHFQINSSIEKGKKMYHFELESFASVVDLINFYVNHRRAVTFASKCIISTPVAAGHKTGEQAEIRDIEAAYMHILKRDQEPSTPRMTLTLQQKVQLNQASRYQKPIFSKSTHNLAMFENPKPVTPTLPESFKLRALPIPNRSDSSSQDENDYDSVDYAAMDDILDASTAGPCSPSRPSSSLTLKHNFAKPFSSSCHNLTRSPSPAAAHRKSSTANLTASSTQATPSRTNRPFSPVGEKPPLPPRPMDIFNPSRPTTCKAPEETMKKAVPTSEQFNDYDDVQRTRMSRLASSHNIHTDAEKLKRLSDESSSSADYDSLPSDRSVMTSRDSGIYGSPSPPHEKIDNFSVPLLYKLKSYLQCATAKEIALALTYEDAILLQMNGNVHNALSNLLLPKNAELRSKLLERCRLVMLSVILSIVTSNDGDRLKQWIDVCQELLNLGNFFEFINVMEAVQSTLIKKTGYASWLSVDAQHNNVLEEMKKSWQTMKNGDALKYSTTTIPMIQPILEIMGGVDAKFLDIEAFTNDYQTLFRWMEEAKEWSRRADDLGAELKSRIGMKKCGDHPLTHIGLKNLMFSNIRSKQDKYDIVIDRIETLIENRRHSQA